MRELAGRMRSIDPGAGAALQVVAHFDALVEARAGLEATVRAAAVLAGCAAGLAVPGRRLRVRVEPDGRRVDRELAGLVGPEGWRAAGGLAGAVGSDGLRVDREPAAFAGPDGRHVDGESVGLAVPEGRCVAGEPAGLAVALPGYPGAFAWLERCAEGPEQAEFDRVVVDRLVAAARIVLDRTGGSQVEGDPAAVELLIDAGAGESARAAAAKRLGLADGQECVVTVSSGGPRPAGAARLGDLDVTITPAGQPAGTRSAVGTAVPARDAAGSYAQARLAFRLAADGEPGPSHVDCADLGGLLALAAGCETPPAVAEVTRLERALGAHPWALETLTAVASEPSLRAAAAILPVHHSTLQGRVDVLAADLGYAPATPAGRTRLTIALALRRFRRTR